MAGRGWRHDCPERLMRILVRCVPLSASPRASAPLPLPRRPRAPSHRRAGSGTPLQRTVHAAGAEADRPNRSRMRNRQLHAALAAFAEVAAWQLASDASEFMTGSEVVIDGGISAR